MRATPAAPRLERACAVRGILLRALRTASAPTARSSITQWCNPPLATTVTEWPAFSISVRSPSHSMRTKLDGHLLPLPYRADRQGAA